jgi:archaetidylinositol phosphate synthase
MNAGTFLEATRLATNPLANLERRCLIAIAHALPRWVTSDRLTALALAAMALTGACYPLAHRHPWTLYLAVLGLTLNWFGDSLDGTVARVRCCQRPRYGFYVDHIVDCLGATFVLAGLAASDYMSASIAMAVLIAYLLLSIEIYLATYCLAVFKLSFWGLGPTELRILLAAGTLALRSDPRVDILNSSYRLFDVGGVVAIAALLLILISSVVRNTRALYGAEPLP